MRQDLYDILTDNPIIAAVKDEEGRKVCMELPDAGIVFVLYGTIATIADIVKELKASGKKVFVHMELIQGLSVKTDAVDFIAKYTEADGIISTRAEQIRRGREQGLATIYRVFLIDSKALSTINASVKEYTDAIEILPGLMPKMIRKMVEEMKIPVITGGLISEKEDVIQALRAGAIAISTTCQEVWSM